MTKRRGPVRRDLIKIRATPLVRMPKSVFFAKIKSACKTGVVPADISIRTINWDHAEGHRYNAGATLSAADARNLRACYRVLADPTTTIDVDVVTRRRKPAVRFERPS